MLKNQEQQQEVLHSAFNVQTHKETFINYLELVILKDGTIEYAIPSHQMKALNVIAERKGLTQIEASNLCPPEYYLDFTAWLCKEAELIMVWNEFFIGAPNDKQIEALIMLMTEGLYYGNIDVDRTEGSNTLLHTNK